MLPLLRKDLPWIAPLFVVQAIVLVLVASAEHVSGAWLRTEMQDFLVLHFLLWCPAALAAAILALHEPILGTQEFLAHRSIGPRDAHRARMLLGVAFVLGLTLVWILFDLLRLAGNGLIGVAFMDSSPLLLIGSLGLFALTSFAVTNYALRLPVSWPLRVVALGLLGFGVVLVHGVLSSDRDFGDSADASIGLHALGMALLALWFAWQGGRITATTHDPDLPIPGPALRSMLYASAPLLLLVTVLGVTLLEEMTSEPLRDARPMLLATKEHGVGLGYRDREGRYTVLSQDREWLAGDVPRGSILWTQRAPSVGADMPDLFRFRFDTGRTSFRTFPEALRGSWTFVLGGRPETLHAWLRAYGSFDAPPPAIVPRPDGERFSRRAFFLELREWDERFTFVIDPADRSVWHLKLGDSVTAPTLHRSNLPGQGAILGQRFAQARAGVWNPAILTEAGPYAWKDSEWVATPQKASASDEHEVVDALTPRIQARGNEGELLAEQQLRISGPAEWIGAALFVAPTLLRPLPSALWAVVAPDRDSRRDWSKGLVLGDRPWLFVLPLLGTLLSLLRIRRRMQRLGTGARRHRAWLVFAAFLGPATLLLHVTLETDRRHRRLATTPSPAPRITARDASAG